MTSDFRRHFTEHHRLVEKSIDALETTFESASRALVSALAAGNKVITLGNGGSAAEASHFAEELVGRYRATRRPFPAICLTSDSAAVTCIANDFGYEAVFDRQIEAFAQKGDVVVAMSTSGRSENVLRALRTAKAQGAVTMALTGEAGLNGVDADFVLAVPSADSAYIQEVHLILIHVWCAVVDQSVAGE
jgi:D-sedoheptulose 7-phosphate isomerase